MGPKKGDIFKEPEKCERERIERMIMNIMRIWIKLTRGFVFS